MTHRPENEHDKALSKYVNLSIIIVILYTIIEFIVSTKTGESHDVLTGFVYGFFGTEVAMSGFIKIHKIKRS